MTKRTHIIAAVVEHKPGVLYSVSNMFRRRGFNIESITVGTSEKKGTARMTMTVKGDEKTAVNLGHAAEMAFLCRAVRHLPPLAGTGIEY